MTTISETDTRILFVQSGGGDDGKPLVATAVLLVTKEPLAQNDISEILDVRGGPLIFNTNAYASLDLRRPSALPWRSRTQRVWLHAGIGDLESLEGTRADWVVDSWPRMKRGRPVEVNTGSGSTAPAKAALIVADIGISVALLPGNEHLAVEEALASLRARQESQSLHAVAARPRRAATPRRTRL